MTHFSFACQSWLPQHLVSRCMGVFGNSRISFIKNAGISAFIKHYGVDLSEAEHPTGQDYASFNDFFTRELKSGARPIDQTPGAIVSPVDGCVSELGQLSEGQLLQAKGQYYSVSDLLRTIAQFSLGPLINLEQLRGEGLYHAY